MDELLSESGERRFSAAENESDHFVSCEEEEASLSPYVKRRTGDQESGAAAENESKKSKLSLSDMNSNQCTPDQMSGYTSNDSISFLSVDDLPSSPIFRSKKNRHLGQENLVQDKTYSSTTASTSMPARDEHHLPSNNVKTNSSELEISSPEIVPPVSSSSYFATRKASQEREVKNFGLSKDASNVRLHLLDQTRAILPLRLALDSSESSCIIHQLDVEDILERSKGKGEVLLDEFKRKMAEVKRISSRGLTHWGGGKTSWINIGEEEEHEKSGTSWREEEWLPERVGRRTRAASRSRGRSSIQENDDVYECDEVKKQLNRKNLLKAPIGDDTDEDDFIDDKDAEYEYEEEKKPVKGKGRVKGKRGRKIGVKGKKGKVENNPSVEEFFNPIYKSDINVELSEEGASEDVKFMSGPYLQEYSGLGRGSSSTRTRPRKRGTCPLCSIEFEMKELSVHAADCQGSG